MCRLVGFVFVGVLSPAGRGLVLSVSSAASLTAGIPTFILFRTATSWTLVAQVPDSAQPREKMLYSSARAGLQQMSGAAHVLHCGSVEELLFVRNFSGEW